MANLESDVGRVCFGGPRFLLRRGGDLAGGVKLNTFVRPKKSSSTPDRAFEYVQKAADISLYHGQTKLSPSGVGYICLLEKAQGDQLLVTIRSQGLRGWTSAGALVPLNHADAYFSQQIAANPRDSFALLMRGVVRYENDDLDRAFADVNEALRLDPKYVAALVERAYLWQCRDRLDLAISDVNQAIQLDSRNSYAYVERGVFHFGTKDFGKAIRDFEQAARLGSRSAAIHLCKGMIHVERGEGEPAIAEFNLAIERDPKRLDAYIGLATVYLLKSDSHKALEVFNKAIEVDPRSPEAHQARAVYFLSHGKHEKALEDLNEAVRLDPTTASHLRVCAACFSRGASLLERLRTWTARPGSNQTTPKGSKVEPGSWRPVLTPKSAMACRPLPQRPEHAS